MKRNIVVYTFVAFCLAAPRTAWSQEIPTVTEGSIIRLQLRNAREMRAKLIAIRADSLVLQRSIDKPLSSVARTDIITLEARMPNPHRGRSAAYGALLGVLTAGATYLVLSDVFADQCDDCLPPTTREKLMGVSAFMGGGAALGAMGGLIAAGSVWQPARF